ncbi:uncharacterized protein [Diadema antillarum]|uniref:uncharacterized protein n=1 Tax=Diadema antillarum TaxID=105358 RepID=UPI003A8AC6D7
MRRSKSTLIVAILCLSFQHVLSEIRCVKWMDESISHNNNRSDHEDDGCNLLQSDTSDFISDSQDQTSGKLTPERQRDGCFYTSEKDAAFCDSEETSVPAKRSSQVSIPLSSAKVSRNNCTIPIAVKLIQPDVRFLSRNGHCCRAGRRSKLSQTSRRRHQNFLTPYNGRRRQVPKLSQLKRDSGQSRETCDRESVRHRPVLQSARDRLPFCNIVHVKSSVVCTGTMISSTHVLTAAHCVHNGDQFLSRTRNMRVVSIPSGRDDFAARRVRSIRVPRHWWRVSGGREDIRRSDSERAIYDFAVLTLDHPVPDLRGCPRNGTINLKVLPHQGHHLRSTSVRIHFTSFVATAEEQIWETSCATLDHSTAVVRSGLVATGCPVHDGSSGAAVFAHSGSSSCFLGLISHEVRLASSQHYVVVNVINHVRKRIVCSMMAADGSIEACSNVKPTKHIGFISYTRL